MVQTITPKNALLQHPDVVLAINLVRSYYPDQTVTFDVIAIQALSLDSYANTFYYVRTLQDTSVFSVGAQDSVQLFAGSSCLCLASAIENTKNNMFIGFKIVAILPPVTLNLVPVVEGFTCYWRVQKDGIDFPSPFAFHGSVYVGAASSPSQGFQIEPGEIFWSTRLDNVQPSAIVTITPTQQGGYTIIPIPYQE